MTVSRETDTVETDESQLELENPEGEDEDEEDDNQLLSPEVSRVVGAAYSDAGMFVRGEVDAWLGQVEEREKRLERVEDVPKYVRQLLGISPLDPGRDSPTRPDDPNYTEETIYPVEDFEEASEDAEDEADEDEKSEVPATKKPVTASSVEEEPSPNDKLANDLKSAVIEGIRTALAERNDKREEGEQ